MAILNILREGEETLRKKSRPVEVINPRVLRLLDDMKETLSQANGVGLAAPQVGIIRRACIVMETNVPEGEDEYFIELVNPEIIERDGEQEGGDLSARRAQHFIGKILPAVLPQEKGVQRDDIDQTRKHGRGVEQRPADLVDARNLHKLRHIGKFRDSNLL